MDHNEREIQGIVVQAQQGDADSLTQLFEVFHDRVYRYVLLRTSDITTAEDLTQTVFLDMLRALPKYRPLRRAKFSTWLFQIAHHKLVDHYRRSRPEVPLEEGHPLPAPQRDVGATLDVEAAMQQLPERYQTVLHLRFREDLSHKEIALVLGLSSGNVRVLQHRALQELERLLDGELDLQTT